MSNVCELGRIKLRKGTESGAFFSPKNLYEDAAYSDPLGADRIMQQLPWMNENGGITDLRNALLNILPSTSAIRNFSPIQAIGSLRDLGMVAASLKRKGVEPTEVVPGAEVVLQALSEITGTVPRDTVYTYGFGNPSGERERKFTSRSEEEVFISSFRKGMSQLDSSIVNLHALREISPYDPEFARNCNDARTHFSLMTQTIGVVHREVPAEVFTGILRPYFDPFQVGDKCFDAPGGAQMPVLFIDQLVWGSDCKDEIYNTYLNENTKYVPDQYKFLKSKYTDKPSLTTRITQALSIADIPSSRLLGSGNALLGLLDEQLRFRGVHLRVARENFKLRGPDDLGSGGFQTDILLYLINQTNMRRTQIRNKLSNN